MAEDMNNIPSADTRELLNKMKNIASDLWGGPRTDISAVPKPPAEKPAKVVVKHPTISIDNLWMTADETIEWTDALAHERAVDGLTSQIMWSFYHRKAEAVLRGDLNAYAEVLRKTNPLGELTEFAQGISMKAPDPDYLEAAFNIREDLIESGKKYLSAMGVRIARDLFACLPVSGVRVTAMRNGRPAMEVMYQREQLLHRNFSFLDPVKLTEECGAKFD